MSLSLITINVGAPSLERARRQLKWLAERPEHIFVLTETKATPGSQLLAHACAAANYSVTFPAHDPGELGIMIVSKVATTPDPLTGALSYLPARAAGVVVGTSNGPLRCSASTSHHVTRRWTRPSAKSAGSRASTPRWRPPNPASQYCCWVT